MGAAPNFGVATLTAFAMTAAASDPDGDTVTSDWDIGDGTLSLTQVGGSSAAC